MRLESTRDDMGCHDLMQCATDSLGTAILGCGITLGGGTTLGYGVSLGGNGVAGIIVGTWDFLVAGRRVSGFLISGGVKGDMDVAGGGMGVLGIQLVNSYRSLDIYVNFPCWLIAGVSFIAQEKKLRSWMILSSAETVGWVGQSCRNSTVYENMSDFVTI